MIWQDAIDISLGLGGGFSEFMQPYNRGLYDIQREIFGDPNAESSGPNRAIKFCRTINEIKNKEHYATFTIKANLKEPDGFIFEADKISDINPGYWEHHYIGIALKKKNGLKYFVYLNDMQDLKIDKVYRVDFDGKQHKELVIEYGSTLQTKYDNGLKPDYWSSKRAILWNLDNAHVYFDIQTNASIKATYLVRRDSTDTLNNDPKKMHLIIVNEKEICAFHISKNTTTLQSTCSKTLIDLQTKYQSSINYAKKKVFRYPPSSNP